MLKPCPGCHEHRPRTHFYQRHKQDEKRNCVQCRIKANLNSGWYLWAKEGWRSSPQEKQKILIKFGFEYLESFKKAIISWRKGAAPLSVEQENSSKSNASHIRLKNGD
ncbi:MAG: hypothetical protein Q9162_005904 [Coniocarpon cinnabarinum]